MSEPEAKRFTKEVAFVALALFLAPTLFALLFGWWRAPDSFALGAIPMLSLVCGFGSALTLSLRLFKRTGLRIVMTLVFSAIAIPLSLVLAFLGCSLTHWNPVSFH